MRREDRSRRTTALPALISGGVSAVLLAFSMTPTFATLTAQIVHSANTAGTGALIMQETDGTNTCNSTDGGSISTNSATCSTINEYGGNLAMVPGAAAVTNITIKDTGTVAASSFTLVGGTCAQTANGSANGTAVDLCAKYTVLIQSGATTIYTGTAAALGGQTIDILSKLAVSNVAAGGSVPIKITATLDATAGNTYQGLKISQPLTWNFGA
jgi:hypothetical protein